MHYQVFHSSLPEFGLKVIEELALPWLRAAWYQMPEVISKMLAYPTPKERPIPIPDDIEMVKKVTSKTLFLKTHTTLKLHSVIDTMYPVLAISSLMCIDQYYPWAKGQYEVMKGRAKYFVPEPINAEMVADVTRTYSTESYI